MARPRKTKYEYVEQLHLYRKRVKDSDGKYVALYGQTPEELTERILAFSRLQAQGAGRRQQRERQALQEERAMSTSEFVIHNSENGPLSETQFRHIWNYVVRRTAKNRVYYRYVDGVKVAYQVEASWAQRQKTAPSPIPSTLMSPRTFCATHTSRIFCWQEWISRRCSIWLDTSAPRSRWIFTPTSPITARRRFWRK